MVKVTFIWRYWQHFVRIIKSSTPVDVSYSCPQVHRGVKQDMYPARHTCTHTQIHLCMAGRTNQHRWETCSTHIDSLIPFLFFCWSGGKSASRPQIPGFLPRCWPLATPNTEVYCLTSFAGTQTSSYYYTQAGPDQMSPQWSDFRPLGSPISKPHACVCLVAAPQTSYPSCCWSGLKFTCDVYLCSHTHTDDWSSPWKHPSPLAGA